MRAFYSGDPPDCAKLSVRRLTSTGPAASFTPADDYLSTSAQVTATIHRIETQKIFVDSNDVCVFSILETRALAKPILVADWYHLEIDRIASSIRVFDTGPFASRSVESGDGSAVDPVCHMSAATAAQR
jgi:hypothetical protein